MLSERQCEGWLEGYLLTRRHERLRFRRTLHQGQAGQFRLPWLPLVDPSADLPADQPRQHPVRGYKEEGTIITPFDMTVLNDLDRFHLVIVTIDRVPQTGEKGAT